MEELKKHLEAAAKALKNAPPPGAAAAEGEAGLPPWLVPTLLEILQLVLKRIGGGGA